MTPSQKGILAGQPGQRERRPGVSRLMVVLLVAACLLSVANSVMNVVSINQIQASRKRSLDVVCAANSAIIDAGRAVITGGAPKPGQRPTRFELNLERLGYPPPPVRRAQAQKAATEYGRGIAHAIETQAHVKGLVRQDGSLNCAALARFTNAK